MALYAYASVLLLHTRHNTDISHTNTHTLTQSQARAHANIQTHGTFSLSHSRSRTHKLGGYFIWISACECVCARINRANVRNDFGYSVCLLPVYSGYEYVSDNDNEIEDPSVYRRYVCSDIDSGIRAYATLYACMLVCVCVCTKTKNTLELNSKLSSIHQLSPLSINGWAVGKTALANGLNYGFSFPIEISAQFSIPVTTPTKMSKRTKIRNYTNIHRVVRRCTHVNCFYFHFAKIPIVCHTKMGRRRGTDSERKQTNPNRITILWSNIITFGELWFDWRKGWSVPLCNCVNGHRVMNWTALEMILRTFRKSMCLCAYCKRFEK